MQDFKNLQVWQKSHALVLDVYAKTANFPTNEMYGLVSQMRQAAVSIPSNIAEGSSRGGDKEFAQFLRIACGSTSELEYLFVLVADLAYLEKRTAAYIGDQTVEVRRMLSGLLGTLKTRSSWLEAGSWKLGAIKTALEFRSRRARRRRGR